MDTETSPLEQIEEIAQDAESEIEAIVAHEAEVSRDEMVAANDTARRTLSPLPYPAVG